MTHTTIPIFRNSQIHLICILGKTQREYAKDVFI